MLELALVVGIVLVIAAITVVRPGWMVLAMGVFLFVQSGVIRLPGLPTDARALFSRMDEVALLVLVLRTTVWLVATNRGHIGRAVRTFPAALWGLGILAGVGAISALLNRVELVQASVGIFLTVKAGLWLYVARYLRVNDRHVVLYGHVVSGLFIGALAVALLQLAGVSMPWHPNVRPISGEFAGTSIFSQHTVFGSSMAVAVGLGVAALALRGERGVGALVTGVGLLGIFLSSVRRLLISIPLAALLSIWATSRYRQTLADLGRLLRSRPGQLAAIAAAIVLVVVTGPRLVHLASDTWQEYVVNAANRDRYELYGGAVRLVVDSPLVGRGPGTYGSYTSVLYHSTAYAELGMRISNALKMGAPYASLLGEVGLLGAAAFVAFVALVLRDLLRIARRVTPTVERALATAAAFMIVDMLIESLVHPTFRDSFIVFFVFVGAGTALSLSAARQGGAATAWDPGVLDGKARSLGVLSGVLAIAALTVVLGLVVPTA